MFKARGKTTVSRPFLSRFARDVRGNTLAIMAAAMVPLTGLVGGGIDLSRMYIVKTRLQHACDAGALAGRKAMGGGTWSQSNNMPNATAQTFFKANYAAGSYGSSNLTYSFSENAGTVTGTASAQVPLTLVKVLYGSAWAQNNSQQTLAVTCSTEMRLPNTDVMFVLDTTGSMGDTPSGDTQSKLASLKESVKCFYEIVARLDTDATCTTGTPGGGTGSQVQIRFGFVPYSTNANVGYLLKPEWVADSWKYQSRLGRWWVMTKNKVSSANVSQGGVPQASCNNAAAAAAGYNSSTDDKGSGSAPYPNGRVRKMTTVQTNVTSWSNNTCYATQTTTAKEFTLTEGVTPTANDLFEDWHYGSVTQPLTGLKSGTNWNTSYTLPIASGGANKTITWDGCVEERHTVKAASYSPIPSDADDLDLDAIPTSGDANSLWAPVLDDVIFTRNGSSGWTTNESFTTAEYGNQSSYVCPTAAKKLQPWPDAVTFDNYVNSLVANGNTYHDIGLIWGARLMSPTGLFASENAYTPQGGEIQRNLIFMTDGDPCTDGGNYQAYGVAWYDQRQTSVALDHGVQHCTGGSPLPDQVNVRVEALCGAIKNKNITLWVISFGALASTTQTRLTNCASSGKYFTANNRAQLQATFKSIADQISQLRLTQ